MALRIVRQSLWGGVLVSFLLIGLIAAGIA